ncbi:MAG: diguanylate cyclase [Geobacteraceae bacterium]|nr:diguanylate cyclase [Geobacteraceae bacterium]
MKDTVTLENFLKALKSYDSMRGYSLSLYGETNGSVVSEGHFLQLCTNQGEQPYIESIYDLWLEKHVQTALKRNKPVVFKCLGGILCFTVPFNFQGAAFCLYGYGVREEKLDIKQIATIAKEKKLHILSCIEALANLPVKTIETVQHDVNDIQRILPSLTEQNLYKPLYHSCINVLKTMTELSSRIERLKSVEEVISNCAATLEGLFNTRKIAFALRSEKNHGLHLVGTGDLQQELGRLPEKTIQEMLSEQNAGSSVSAEKILIENGIQLQASHVACFPLITDEGLLGAILCFDCKLTALAASMIELLAGRAIARIVNLQKELKQSHDQALADRLLSLKNSFLKTETRDELYRVILETVSELVSASRGSIMLVDNNGKSLRIKSAKGMKTELAKIVAVRIGDGIAGKVAESGTPILVNDLESDNRISMSRRPRFKTNSLICIPLKHRDNVIGVLNLSDKENLESFTESDMNLALSFVNLAALMIEHSLAVERSTALEQLAITDSLTGLYNRRFLTRRMEEELNRSAHQNQSFSVLLLDLDYFKSYNDMCGHLAGDEALKKTAAIMKSSVRDMDTAVRFGGEEFCIILPGTSKKEAFPVAERIRQEISKETFQHCNQMPMGMLTISAGISSFPEDGNTINELIHAADVALYRAKEQGKNRVVLAHKTPETGVVSL